jgi:hypothetical protein
MPVDAHEEEPDLVRITLRGRMAPADHAALLFFVTRAIERLRRVRLLVVLEDFEGWTKAEEWGDAELRLEDDAAIVKMAIAGAIGWKDEVFAFIGQPFRRLPIEYFESEDAARTWLQT